MRFGSLFAGIGGIDLGFERAGMECAWQVENDEWCGRVLAKHWPDVPRWRDVRGFLAHAECDQVRHECRWGSRACREGSFVPGDYGEEWQVDLVAGGFPCQPVSLAGKQAAQADERWLWPEFARVLRALRPRYAVLENVPGLLTANQGRAAQEVFGDLAQHGYDAEWASVPAAAVGAPHLRYRVFIVARLAQHTDAERERQQKPPQRDGASQRGLEEGAPRDDADGLRHDVADAEREGRGQWPGREPQAGGRAEPEDGGAEVADADGEAWDPAWTTGKEVFRSPPSERVGRRGGGDGNPWATEPAVGRVANGIPRRVDRLRGLGNAVVPQVAEWVGRRIMEVEDGLSNQEA